MYGYSGIDYIEVIRDLCGSELDPQSVLEFSEFFNIGIPSDTPEIKTALHYVTICCETNYIFSVKELDWLEIASEVCELRLEGERLLIIVKVECDPADYYLNCAALVKLLSHVKENESIYVFVFDDGIALGSRRDNNSEIKNNFCVSPFIAIDDDLRSLEAKEEEFLYNFVISEWEEYPQVIQEYSLNEQAVEMTKYDRLRFDTDYIAFLNSLSAKKGFSTSRQIEEYMSSYDERLPDFYTYKETSAILNKVGEDSKTSYDVLNEAKDAEKQAADFREDNDPDTNQISEEVTDTFTQQFSAEAFDDAELLLKELLKNK